MGSTPCAPSVRHAARVLFRHRRSRRYASRPRRTCGCNVHSVAHQRLRQRPPTRAPAQRRQKPFLACRLCFPLRRPVSRASHRDHITRMRWCCREIANHTRPSIYCTPTPVRSFLHPRRLPVPHPPSRIRPRHGLRNQPSSHIQTASPATARVQCTFATAAAQSASATWPSSRAVVAMQL